MSANATHTRDASDGGRGRARAVAPRALAQAAARAKVLARAVEGADGGEDLSPEDLNRINDRIPTVKLYDRIESELWEELEHAYGCRIMAPFVGPPHTHPRIAVERGLAQLCAARHARVACGDYIPSPGPLAVIGGAINVDYGHDAHHLKPLRTARDIGRRPSREGGWCDHEPGECVCAQFSAHIFIHSIYDIDPQEIADCIASNQAHVAYAVAHMFDGMSGTFGKGEMTWHLDSNLRVVATARGERIPYVHGPALWAARGFAPVSQGTLCAHVKQVIGDTSVLELRLGPAGLVNLTPSVWTGAVRPGACVYSLPSSAINRGVSVGLQSAQWDHVRVYSFGRLLAYADEGRDHVPVSPAIVGTLALGLAGEPRNAATWRSTHRSAAELMRRVDNLPQELKPRAAFAAAILAFCAGVSDEAALLADVRAREGGVWAAHGRALDLQPQWLVNTADARRYAWRACEVTATVGTAATVVPSLYHRVQRALTHTASTAVVAHAAAPAVSHLAAATAVGVGLGAFAAAAAFGVAAAVVVTAARQALAESGPPDPDHVAPTTPGAIGAYAFGPTRLVKPPTAPVADGSSVTPADFRPKHARPQASLMHPGGIVFGRVAVRYHGPGPNSEYVALRERVVRDTPPVVEGAMSKLTVSWRRTSVFKELTTLRSTRAAFSSSDQSFDQWVRRYPAGQRAVFTEARDRWKNGNLNRRDFEVGSFVKIEKHVTPVPADLLNQSDFDDNYKTPRAIITQSPLTHAVQGPVISQVQAEFLAAVRTSGDTITGNSSAEDVGEFFQSRFARYRAPVFLWADATKLDCHIRAPQQKFLETEFFGPTHVDPDIAPFFKTLHRVNGTSRHGVRFTGGHRMASGDDKTWLYDTVLNLAYSSMGLYDQSYYVFGLAVQGDDMLAIVDVPGDATDDDLEQACRSMESSIRDVGIVVDVQWSRDPARVEFCSRLLYPTTDGWVAGGKIGRVLSRAGYFLDLPNEQTRRSAAMSSYNDNYHVPFLREYFARVLELTKGERMRGRSSEYAIHAARRHDYDEHTMDFVTRRYGLTYEDLREFQELLDRVTSLPFQLDWAPITRLVAIDQ